MAEQIEEQIQGEVVSGGDGGKGKSGEQIALDNRLNLYNQILKLKEPGFSDVYKKAGFKKFDALLKDNQEFQSELINDLIDRGFKIDPENFSAAYTNIKPVNVYELPKEEIADTPPPILEKEGDGGSIYDKFSTFGALKNLAKSVYKYGKESFETLSTFGKRGALTGMGTLNAQAENFATGTVDTRNLAKYLKQAHEVGTTQLEADFAREDGMLQDSWDMAKILVPSVVESFANMLTAGSKKISGATILGATGGATVGTFMFPGVGTLGGAVTGGSRALQYAMLQQGYNLEFVGTVLDELQTQKLVNLDADEKTIEAQLKAAISNKQIMAPIYKKANIRAAAITGVDAIFAGMGTSVLRNITKSKIAGQALNTPAGKLLSKFAETTVSNPVYQQTARLANRVAQIDRKVQGSKLGKAGATVGVADIVGGAAGETLAQSLTQENLDYKSIAVEGLAEGKLINTLRQLGKIGQQKNIQQAASNVAEGKPPGEAEDEFVAVTQKELDDYKKGIVTPERAAGIIDDLDISMGNPNHINKLAVTDPLYAEMIKYAYDKAIKAFENQKLYGVALTNVGELYNLQEDGVREAINPSSSSYNPKIAEEFKNTLSVLQQQYKEQTGDDSEDATGVSGEVGGGTESEQAESQQRTSEEEAGDGGVVQTAADEVRLSDIDEMLADDDDFFNQSGDRLLSPEERQDLEQERARLTGGAAAPATGATTGATPAAAPAAVVAQPSTAAAQPVPPTDEQIADDIKNKRFARFKYKSEDEVPEQFKSRISSKGETNGVPFVRVTLPQSVADYEVAKAAATPATETAPATEGGTTAVPAEGETTTTTAAETAPVAITQSDVTLRELGKPGVDETIKVNYNGEPLGIIAFKADKNAFQTTDGETYATKQEAIDAVINVYNNKVGAVPAAETTAVAETTTSTAEQPTKKRGKKATTTAEAAPTAAQPTPAPKEIKVSDVEIRKGKTHDKDGVYEAVYKGKVIGKMSFDKKEKMWVDESGDRFAQKKDAVAKMVLQYNMKAEAAAETTTAKGEGKGKAAPTGKAEPAPTTTETKGETKPTETTETKTENDKNIDFVFESHPQLSGIGTRQQYAEYLKTIFPKSKVKDIVYHGTDDKESFNSILKNGFQTSKNFGDKYWLTPINHKITGDTSLYSTADYGDNIISALINVNKYETVRKNDFTGSESENPALTGVRKDESNDTMIVRQGSSALFDKNRKDYDAEWAKKADKVGFYIVFDPKQIHVLGGEKDVQGFKNFVANAKPTEKTETKPTTSAAPSKAPSFSEFDAISADRSKMKEAKAEFIAKHGQLAYDAMKEISANFTKITKALQEKEILTKKC